MVMRAHSNGFFDIMLGTSTFWTEVVFRIGLIVGLFIFVMVLMVFLRSRRRLAASGSRRLFSRLRKDDRGTSAMIEFVLMVPIILVFFIVLGQLIISTRNAMVVHYAAYSAARSARVHMPVLTGLGNKLTDSSFSTGSDIESFISARPDSSDYFIRAEHAARNALVTISPLNSDLDCKSSCNVPEFFKHLDLQGNLGDKRAGAGALAVRTKYAYDDANSDLRIYFGEIATSSSAKLLNSDWTGTDIVFSNGSHQLKDGSVIPKEIDLAYPTTAELEYYSLPIAPYFANLCFGKQKKCLFGINKDLVPGRYVIPIYAKVTVY